MSRPVALDYIMLAAIGLMWGSQFALNELAIETYSPLTVAAGRVFIGFLTLSLVLLVVPVKVVTEASGAPRQPWALYCGIAVAEAIVPCFLIPWGQQQVDSSIAAILLATVPIITLLLAPVFLKEERWGYIAALSAIIGFAGVVVLLHDTFALHDMLALALIIAALAIGRFKSA